MLLTASSNQSKLHSIVS